MMLCKITTILASAVALTTAAAVTAPPSIEFEYYTVKDCKASELSAVTLSKSGQCVNLHGNALSFHVGGPSTNAQVPKGCVVSGYAEAGCKGALNLQVQGPSDAAKCYVTGTNMGRQYPARSVVLTCK